MLNFNCFNIITMHITDWLMLIAVVETLSYVISGRGIWWWWVLETHSGSALVRVSYQGDPRHPHCHRFWQCKTRRAVRGTSVPPSSLQGSHKTGGLDPSGRTGQRQSVHAHKILLVISYTTSYKKKKILVKWLTGWVFFCFVFLNVYIFAFHKQTLTD